MYFPETQSHQAVGLNIWVYILGCKGIVSQCKDPSTAWHILWQWTSDILVHWQYLLPGSTCAQDLAPDVLQGHLPYLLLFFTVFPGLGIRFIHLCLKQNILLHYAGNVFFVHFLAHFRQAPNSDQRWLTKMFLLNKTFFSHEKFFYLLLSCPPAPAPTPHT